MTETAFFHPAWAFIAVALALPFLRGDWWRYLLLIPPLVAFWVVTSVPAGTYGTIGYLGQTLVLGHVDALSRLFGNVFAIQAFVGMLYGLKERDKAHQAAACLYVAGAFGSVFAGDYLTVFIFWELMSVSSAFLVWLRRSPRAVRAGLRYFYFHTLGGLFLLAGLLLRYHALGTFAFTHVIPDQARYFDWLILTGFCVNAAVVPLHAWLPDAYPEATIPGAVFMCAFTTKTAVYVLARGFAGFEVLTIAGAVMAVYGVLYAAIENDIRRLLSYDIVSQVGYMVVGIGIGTHMSVNGAVAHAYAHILYKGLLFMSTGCLLYAAGTSRLDRLGGLVRRLPWVMVLYMVGALSISGMPFFNGFISKNMTIFGALEAHRQWVAVMLELAVVGTFLPVAIKLPYFAFWAKPDNREIELTPIPANMYMAMVLSAGLCLAQGLFPGLLYRLLPFPVDFTPYTAWNLLQAALLLGFTGLGFLLMRRHIRPRPGRNLDFDALYRLMGSALTALFSRPLAALDTIWSEAYRKIGLRSLAAAARAAGVFDRSGIDTVVDGIGFAVRGAGRRATRLQTGRLQDHLAWMTIAALLIFGLVWGMVDIWR
jgi:multicomponent Na+:H+ antiporter subunit D